MRGAVKKWRLNCDESFMDAPDVLEQRDLLRRKRTAERTRAWRKRIRGDVTVTQQTTHGDATVYPPVTLRLTVTDPDVTQQNALGDAPNYPRTTCRNELLLKKELQRTPDADAPGRAPAERDSDSLFDVPEPPPTAAPPLTNGQRAQRLATHWHELTNGECNFPAALGVLKKFLSRSDEDVRIALQQILQAHKPLTVEVLRNMLNDRSSHSNLHVRSDDDPTWRDPNAMSLNALI